MAFNPGPLDPSILYDQKSHVSEAIWNGIERDKFQLIQGSINAKWNLTVQQKHLLNQSGFQMFTHKNSVLTIDHGLITALVERWRPETNSFHFTEGEATITLQDVGYILGLPVVGKPIICQKGELDQRIRLQQLLNIANIKDIPRQKTKAGGVKFTYLFEVWGNCPEDASYEVAWMHTKAYLLYCLGKVLFPTRMKNRVHTVYLQFMNTPEECCSFAWGAAVLAYLYRGLSKASRIDGTALVGCLTLLQVWSYERIHVGRPLPRQGTQDIWLRCVAWEYGRDNSYIPRRSDPHHHGVLYRGELDFTKPSGSIIWRPYDRDKR